MTPGSLKRPPLKDRLTGLYLKLFKDRQILLRSDSRVRCLTLSRRLQTAAAVLVLGCGLWSLFSTAGYLWHAERSGSLARALAESEATQRMLAEAGNRHSEEITRLRLWLGQQGHRQTSTASRIAVLEAALDGATDLAGTLDRERSDLARRLDSLERELAGARASQASLVEHVSDRLRRGIESIEGLASTIGLDLSALVPEKAGAAELGDGKGGPLVIDDTLRDGDRESRPRQWVLRLDRQLERWERLQGVVGRLPLATPLARYRITSKFGKRRDPMSGQIDALHQGIDLAAPAGASVSAPAAGRVVKAGWNGNYGRLIEIAHGNGVRTRYGHLRKILVKEGQKVKPGQRIALVGSSGRSTGPHLHYEVLMRGRPVDPQKVIGAGKQLASGISAPLSLAGSLRTQ